ncbi:predicted protein [Botrytis cinerea T4]|uniref:Uncharacterized protein n=1 Tax=Botryotinia fuckeliana (strain T4) TaxID=999810 RepID=G2Y4Z9_BOTF4|nr:predicted protein [Botrytis cinerea T4]
MYAFIVTQDKHLAITPLPVNFKASLCHFFVAIENRQKP